MAATGCQYDGEGRLDKKLLDQNYSSNNNENWTFDRILLDFKFFFNLKRCIVPTSLYI